MRISKRILSVAMALIMLLGVCVVPSYAAGEAYPTGQEDASKINIKFAVEQVDSIEWEDYGTSLSATDNNLYAVTIYAKAAYGINQIQVPLHFDKTKFSPLMWADDAPVDNGALGYDGWYGDNDSQDVYDFYPGEAMEDSTMLRANGNTAANKGAAAYIPMGNTTNYGVMNNDVRYVDSSNPAVAAWVNGLSANTGVMYRFYLNMTTKMAYLNVKNNAVITDWCNIGTIYFVRNDGVSEADAVGAEFGFTAANSYGSQGLLDTSGQTKYGTSYAESEPGLHYVENAFVEAAAEPTIVNPLKGQIRFDKKDGAYAGTFDVRALATITEKDFNATFTDAATAEDMIEEIGFVFAAGSNVGTPDMAGVKALVENGTALSGYEKKTVDYISTGATNVAAGNYVFSCIVTDVPDADKADSLVAVGYIKWTDAEGTHYNYYPAAQEISFNALYTAHYNSAFPQA